MTADEYAATKSVLAEFYRAIEEDESSFEITDELMDAVNIGCECIGVVIEAIERTRQR